MAKFVGLFISFLIGVVFSELFLVTDWRERIPVIRPLGQRIQLPSAVQRPRADKPSPAAPADAAASGAAWQDLTAGRAKEAQDAFLGILVFNPSNEEAMRGLIAARRRLTKDDPAALRRQAEQYRMAVAQGSETEEHYSARSMEFLATASLTAANQIAAERSRRAAITLPKQTKVTPPQRVAPTAAAMKPAPPPRQPETPRSRAPTAGSRGSGTDTKRPARTPGERPAPVERRQQGPAAVAPSPPPEPTLDENEPFSLMSVGPIRRRARASEIVGHLTLAGYAARMSQKDGSGPYLITLGPYRRSAVQVITQIIQSRFGSVPIAVRAVP